MSLLKNFKERQAYKAAAWLGKQSVSQKAFANECGIECKKARQVLKSIQEKNWGDVERKKVKIAYNYWSKALASLRAFESQWKEEELKSVGFLEENVEACLNCRQYFEGLAKFDEKKWKDYIARLEEQSKYVEPEKKEGEKVV